MTLVGMAYCFCRRCHHNRAAAQREIEQQDLDDAFSGRKNKDKSTTSLRTGQDKLDGVVIFCVDNWHRRVVWPNLASSTCAIFSALNPTEHRALSLSLSIYLVGMRHKRTSPKGDSRCAGLILYIA